VIDEAVDWLPQEAFSTAAVSAVFDPSISAWSQTWFANAKASVASSVVGEGRQAQAAIQRLSGDYVSVEMSGRGKRCLVETALGVVLADQVLNDADRHLLDVFAAEVAQDLLVRLEQDLADTTAKLHARQLVIGVCLGTTEAFSVLCPQQSLVAKLKSRLAAPAAARSPLGSRRTALKPTRVVAKGVLGRAELSVSELESLAVGDVLVLDRSLGDTAELRLAETGQLVAAGKLHCEKGQTCIQL
jgi:flagellar motor switch/type III secretory pathway protein FliN